MCFDNLSSYIRNHVNMLLKQEFLEIIIDHAEFFMPYIKINTQQFLYSQIGDMSR